MPAEALRRAPLPAGEGDDPPAPGDGEREGERRRQAGILQQRRHQERHPREEGTSGRHRPGAGARERHRAADPGDGGRPGRNAHPVHRHRAGRTGAQRAGLKTAVLFHSRRPPAVLKSTAGGLPLSHVSGCISKAHKLRTHPFFS